MVQGILGVQGIPGLSTAYQPISLMRNHDLYQIWAASWQNQKCGYAPIEDSDQPGHAQADLSLRLAHTHFVGFVMSRLI